MDERNILGGKSLPGTSHLAGLAMARKGVLAELARHAVAGCAGATPPIARTIDTMYDYK